MQRAGRDAGLAALACTVAVATRGPAPPVLLAACILLACGTIAGAALAGGERRWAAPLALASGAGLLLVPSPLDAWLPLPALAAAAPMLLVFHAILRPHTADIPRLSAHGTRARTAWRLLPWFTLTLVVASVPLLAGALLPDRLGLASELQGPSGPLLAGLLVAAACIAVALVAQAARPRGDER